MRAKNYCFDWLSSKLWKFISGAQAWKKLMFSCIDVIFYTNKNYLAKICLFTCRMVTYILNHFKAFTLPLDSFTANDFAENNRLILQQKQKCNWHFRGFNKPLAPNILISQFSEFDVFSLKIRRGDTYLTHGG